MTTPTRRRSVDAIIRAALRLAAEYEKSYIDSLRHCTDEGSVVARNNAQENIDDFKRLRRRERAFQ